MRIAVEKVQLALHEAFKAVQFRLDRHKKSDTSTTYSGSGNGEIAHRAGLVPVV